MLMLPSPSRWMIVPPNSSRWLSSALVLLWLVPQPIVVMESGRAKLAVDLHPLDHFLKIGRGSGQWTGR
jgi:hypothetical protein